MLKRKTLGQQVKDTHDDFLKQIETPIECGDMARMIGKYYMKELDSAIENHRKLDKKKLYFMVNVKKDRLFFRAIKVTVGVIDEPLKLYHADLDLWEYDYQKDELKLLWSLPAEYSFRNLISNKEQVPPKLLHWIYQYLKQKKQEISSKNAS